MKNIKELSKALPEFEKVLGYSFKDKKNIILALTHSSYANENKELGLQYNERIEFLGDSILGLSISEKIYKSYKNLSEGELTKVRSNIVCEQSLAICANKIQISKFILLGKGEEITGGRHRDALLADAFEAIIGAIYIDSGLEDAKAFVYRQMDGLIDQCAKGKVAMDYKTQFQEIIQVRNDRKVSYEIIHEEGPDHNKFFIAQVTVDGEIAGTGSGRSKKESEQNAAKEALDKQWK